MKQQTMVYKPSKLIQDFYMPPSRYYYNNDAGLSPFTSIKAAQAQTIPHAKPALNRDYLRSRRVKQPLYVEPQPPAIMRLYESVPIACYMIASTGRRLVRLVVSGFRHMLHAITRMASVASAYVASALTLRHIPLFPHKYTLRGGLQKDFSGKIFTFGKLALLAVPLLLLGAWIAWQGILPGTIQLQSKPHAAEQTKQPSDTATSQAGANQPQRITDPNNTTVRFTPTSAGGIYPRTTSGTADSTNTFGGRGSGSTSSIASSPSTSMPATATSNGTAAIGVTTPPPVNTVPLPAGIPGVTTPVPVTIPGTTVQADGKQVIGTSPATVTLN